MEWKSQVYGIRLRQIAARGEACTVQSLASAITHLNPHAISKSVFKTKPYWRDGPLPHSQMDVSVIEKTKHLGMGVDRGLLIIKAGREDNKS